MDVTCRGCGITQEWDEASHFCAECGYRLERPPAPFPPPGPLAPPSPGTPAIYATPPPPGPAPFPGYASAPPASPAPFPAQGQAPPWPSRPPAGEATVAPGMYSTTPPVPAAPPMAPPAGAPAGFTMPPTVLSGGPGPSPTQASAWPPASAPPPGAGPQWPGGPAAPAPASPPPWPGAPPAVPWPAGLPDLGSRQAPSRALPWAWICLGLVAVALLGLVIGLPLLRGDKPSSSPAPAAATSAPIAGGTASTPSSPVGQGAPPPVSSAPDPALASPPASPASTGGPAPSPMSASVPAPGYDAAFGGLVKDCDAIDAAASATARSIWHGTSAARAAAAFHGHNKRMAALQGRARALAPPPARAARHQRLLDLIALGVRRTAQLAEAADVEARAGVEAAKPYWEAEIPTLKAYEKARKSL